MEPGNGVNYVLPGMIAMMVVAGLAALLAIASLYNQLTRLREQTQERRRQLDALLQRRQTLVADLMESGQPTILSDASALEALRQAHAAAAIAGTDLSAREKSEGVLTQALQTVEAADPERQKTLQSLASELTFAQQNYNEAALLYNAALEPASARLCAQLFGFHAAALFQPHAPVPPHETPPALSSEEISL